MQDPDVQHLVDQDLPTNQFLQIAPVHPDRTKNYSWTVTYTDIPWTEQSVVFAGNLNSGSYTCSYKTRMGTLTNTCQ
jgi:hypothetical protein